MSSLISKYCNTPPQSEVYLLQTKRGKDYKSYIKKLQ